MNSLKLVYSKKESKPKKQKQVEREITVDDRLASIAELLEHTEYITSYDLRFILDQVNRIDALGDELEENEHNTWTFMKQILNRYKQLQKRQHLKLIK